MKKLKSTKKPNPYVRSIVVTFKVNADELRVILAGAHGSARGNISEFVRYAATHFKPTKEDFQK